MITASVVTASYLEVASVQESLVQRYTTIDGHFLGGSAPHVVVGAGNAHAIVVLGEKDGAACHARAACSGGEVLGVIGDIPSPVYASRQNLNTRRLALREI